MNVYITKYALTKGIIFATGKRFGKGSIDIGEFFSIHGENKNWHTDIKQAKKQAELMRDEKIVSLERQIENLKILKFDNVF